MESAQPLACRAVILNGYLLLVGWFGYLANELSDELGPIDPEGHDSSCFRLVEEIFKKINAIHDGKSMMHDALKGTSDDTRLLRRLKTHIDKIGQETVLPLRTLPPERTAAIIKIKQVGLATAAICTAAKSDLLEADRRFAQALSTSTPPQVEQYAVISVDMVDYSKFAVERETQEGIKGLFGFNQSIQERFKDAIKKAGGDPSEIPIYYSGDGALIYWKADVKKAVHCALAFQRDATARNEHTANVGAKPRRFRIGVATGPVCMQFQFNPAGSLWGFTCAGTAIINAVRIQTACKHSEVLIDETSHNDLPADLKALFKAGKPVKPKKAANRVIPVYCCAPDRSS